MSAPRGMGWAEAVGDRDALLVATASFAMHPRDDVGGTERHTLLVTRDAEGFDLSVGHPFGVVRVGRSASLPALLMALGTHGEGPRDGRPVFGWADDADVFSKSLSHWESRMGRDGRCPVAHPLPVARFEVGGSVLSLLAADGAFILEDGPHPRMVLCRSGEPEAVLRAAGLLLDARTDRERMVAADRLAGAVATFEAEVAERDAPSPAL